MLYTQNAAPKKVFAAKLKNGYKTMAYINALFKGSGSFIDTPSITQVIGIMDEVTTCEKNDVMEKLGQRNYQRISCSFFPR
ncbi:MAG: hypothetical protein MZU97_14935 [Bacillus subtilis]|nr:hypothetical protein [Bacillus subtilis]